MKRTHQLYGEIQLDSEWILLMKDAKELGLEPNDVKDFLEQSSSRNKEGE